MLNAKHQNVDQNKNFVKFLFLDIQVKTAPLGFNYTWRHVKCSMIIDFNKRCKFCEGL